MKVKISLYSMLRVIAGVNQVEVELPDDCPVGELKAILLDKYPQLKHGDGIGDCCHRLFAVR